VPDFWIVDPGQQTLPVLRWTREGCFTVPTAAKGDAVRAEPFEAIELELDLLFED
jgi:hypothetical protein